MMVTIIECAAENECVDVIVTVMCLHDTVYLLIVADSTIEDVLCTVDSTRLTEGTKLISYLYHLTCTEYICWQSISGSSLVKLTQDL